MSVLQVFLFKQICPETSRPWRIAETVYTSDGPRTRFCNGTWYTEEDAKQAFELKLKGFQPHAQP